MKAKAAALFAALALCGCAPIPPKATAETSGASRPDATPQANTANGQEGAVADAYANMSVEDFIKASGFDESPKLLKAWRSEPGHERYRLARKDDFVAHESVRKERQSTIQSEFGGSYELGEFSGNRGENYMFLVVDREKSDADRFGVLLLFDRDGKSYEIHWVHRDADFSNGALLARHSGNVYLEVVDTEGTKKWCDIAWSRSLHKFACLLQPVTTSAQ